jgi:hypothetical protein
LLLGYVLVRFSEVLGDALRSSEIGFELIMADRLQIDDGDLVVALLANVFGGIGLHIHLLAAGAKGESRKQLNRPLPRSFVLLLLLFEDLIALVP